MDKDDLKLIIKDWIETFEFGKRPKPGTATVRRKYEQLVVLYSYILAARTTLAQKRSQNFGSRSWWNACTFCFQKTSDVWHLTFSENGVTGLHRLRSDKTILPVVPAWNGKTLRSGNLHSKSKAVCRPFDGCIRPRKAVYIPALQRTLHSSWQRLC